VEDKIAALATPWGASAVAVIRTSGQGSIEEMSRIFSPGDRLSAAEGHTVVRGALLDGESGGVIDDVIAAVYRGPKSYTGEDSVELFVHGSLPGIERILAVLKRRGFRPAGPGEFTLRAFLNGKLDLTKAEAVNEIVTAKSGAAHSLALHRLGGSVERRIREIKEELLRIYAEVELQLDYSEDEGEAEYREVDLDALRSLGRQCRDLARTYETGRLYQQGIRVALGGRTNAGKSSLFNLFLKEDRSIVSEIHGTTRDYIEAWISIGGIPVLLYDTAGLRAHRDPVEWEGIRRTERILENADIVLYLVDSTGGVLSEDTERLAALKEQGIPCLRLWNKVDLTDEAPPEGFMPVSVQTHEGFSAIERAVVELVPDRTGYGSGEPVIDSLRQRDLLLRAADGLDLAGRSVEEEAPLDMIAVDLKDALDALGEITGEVTSAEILKTIFSDFCVGK
jgi:tRNA modification GTPase